MNSTPPFQHLIAIISRRKWLILSGAAIGMAVAGGGAMLIPARYTAKVLLIFEPQQASRVGDLPALSNPATEDALIQTQVATLLSFNQREHVRLSLPDDKAFQTAFEEMASVNASKAARLEPLTQAWARVAALLPSKLQFPASAPVPAAVRADPPAVVPPGPEEFERKLKVFQEAGSHVIAAAYTAASPELAAAVANRVATSYVERQTEQKRAASSRELAWLGTRIPALKAEVERAERLVREYQASRGYQNVGPSQTSEQQVDDLRRQLAAAEIDAAARQSRLAYVRDHLSGPAALETLNSPLLNGLHQQETVLLQSEAELAATHGELHPQLVQVRNQLRSIRARVGQESELAVRNLANEAAIAGAQVQAVRARLALATAARADEHLNDLDHDVTLRRQILTGLLQRREEVRGQQDILGSDARILSTAALPDRPSSPRALLFVFPAMVVFLAAGSMLAVLLDRLDRTLRSQRDAAEALGIPCLALVPKLRRVSRQRPHEYLLAKPDTAYTEAIRSLVASLKLTGPTPQTVLVSSSVPGEGKTTLAVSLAAYVASLGRRVLLIDLDFRHSTIQRELGGHAEGGVMDLLVHGRPSTEVIQRMPALQLDYLPVLQRPLDPFALFASYHVAKLLDDLRNQYDCVVVDSPPVLAITEARLLASMVSKVLFVVKWGSTRSDVARNALSLLQSVDRDKVAAAVMTQVDLKKHARGHYGDVGEAFVRYKEHYLNG